MNNKETLLQTILNANVAYREGNPVMSDQEFDDLCERAEKEMSPKEWYLFRNSLHEKAGKIQHPFIMGSLDKVKMEDEKSLKSFISKYVKNSLNISAKVDGISCRLEYRNGKLVLSSSRGDGYAGEDFSDKIPFVKNVPLEIPVKETLNIRGELVMFIQDFEKLEGFANPRNATAGVMNRKDWKPSEIENISFIAYTILGPEFSKEEQFKILEQCGFQTAWHTTIKKEDCEKESFVSDLTELFSQEFLYETDGFVLSDSSYKNEDEYRPDAQVALKLNQQVAISKVIDIEWQGPSKDGRFVPLAIVDPVTIGGTVVSKASMHNAAFMLKLGVHYGSEVEICKRGDIIPQIERVL